MIEVVDWEKKSGCIDQWSHLILISLWGIEFTWVKTVISSSKPSCSNCVSWVYSIGHVCEVLPLCACYAVNSLRINRYQIAELCVNVRGRTRDGDTWDLGRHWRRGGGNNALCPQDRPYGRLSRILKNSKSVTCLGINSAHFVKVSRWSVGEFSIYVDCVTSLHVDVDLNELNAWKFVKN